MQHTCKNQYYLEHNCSHVNIWEIFLSLVENDILRISEIMSKNLSYS